MSAQPPPSASAPRQKVIARIVWFLAGGVVNYLLIATPFKWLEQHTALSDYAKSACSIGLSATFFFFWNYFVNFRTDSRRRHALPRYVAAVGCMWALSSTLLGYLKQVDAQMAFTLLGKQVDLDVVATQFFLAGLKFMLYHKWVFPVSKTTPTTNPAEMLPGTKTE